MNREVNEIEVADEGRRAFVIGAVAIASGGTFFGTTTAAAEKRRNVMASIGLPQDPQPTRRISVYVTREHLYNLDKMQEITRNVLGKLGCPKCHSGFDLDFRALLDMVVNPETLEVREIAKMNFNK